MWKARDPWTVTALNPRGTHSGCSDVGTNCSAALGVLCSDEVQGLHRTEYTLILILGARCSSVVERSLVVRCVVGSILHGRPIVLFLIPVTAPRQV